ncbi:unnamed protein product [Cladocopium goreaui]|uniref:Pentacotripeptide-repeat region of PRORP domain-containing protein n=1 Tax=Cladocopium goreaui TaxID=2562237 RepID=A0A9P1BZS1_9DINO|nr:unnamed protein product [Cladocopium goreaui]
MVASHPVMLAHGMEASLSAACSSCTSGAIWSGQEMATCSGAATRFEGATRPALPGCRVGGCGAWQRLAIRRRAVGRICQASMGAGCRSIWHCGIILGTKLSEKIQHAALAVLGSDRCNAQGLQRGAFGRRAAAGPGTDAADAAATCGAGHCVIQQSHQHLRPRTSVVAELAAACADATSLFGAKLGVVWLGNQRMCQRRTVASEPDLDGTVATAMPAAQLRRVVCVHGRLCQWASMDPRASFDAEVLEMFKLLQVQSGDDGVLQVAYCAVLVACATSTQWSQALNFLQRMRLASLPIQLPAWHAVQSSLASTWRWQQALQILTEIKADEVQPDVVNYLTVADACTRGGQPERMFPQLPAMRGQVLSTLLWRRKGIGGEEPPSDIAFSGLAVELLRVMSSGPDQRKGSLQRLHDSKQAEVRYWSCLSRAGSSKGWADHILGSFTTQGNPVAVHDK